MRLSFLLRSGVLAAASFSLLALAGSSARAELIYGISESTVSTTPTGLYSFDSASPASLTSIGNISGVATGQTLKGIDFRASNGLLYAFGTSTADATLAQLYTINLTTGAATAVGSGITLTGNTSTRVSIDFNPVADALRVVTGTGQSYRINATTGALIAQDTSVSSSLLIGDVAYSNNVAGSTSTTLYAYEYIGDTIGTIGSVGGTPNSPNGGVYTSLGSTGITTSAASIGFDISGVTGLGYVSAPTSANGSSLYTVNLGTGALTRINTFSTTLLDISVRTVVSAAAPEPGSLALLGMGALPLVGVVARRRKNKTA